MIIDKRDEIFKETSEALGIKEDTIFKVINYQWKMAHEGLSKEGVNSVDIVGFGRFLFKPHRAIKHIKSLEEIKEALLKKKEGETKPFKIANLDIRIESCEETIEKLKSKLA